VAALRESVKVPPKGDEGPRYRPLLARGVDHRDFFHFRDLLTSEALPDLLVTSSPLATARRLRDECEVNPNADDLRHRVEHRFFLTWSNALPWSTLED